MTVVGPLLVNPGRIRKEGGEVRRARLALVAPRRAPRAPTHRRRSTSPTEEVCVGPLKRSVKYDLGAEPQRKPAVNRGEQD